MTEVNVKTERVDDIPVLLEQLSRMKIQEIFDREFAFHGNWKGLSPGHVIVIWLAHILSKADHRMNQVESWTENCCETLQMCINKEIRSLDLSDDRLAQILKALSNDENWKAFERGVNQHLLRVYDLSDNPIRVDSTTVSGYWTITEEGIFQLGHSKDHRPDLPQVKVKLSTLDPLGMPLVTQIVAGNKADDPLYIPAIKRVKESIAGNGLFYVGDCKMAALATRAFIAKADDFYLCPLSALQFPAEQLDSCLEPVTSGQMQYEEIFRLNDNNEEVLIAKGFQVNKTVEAVVDSQQFQWQERHLIICSEKLRETEQQSFDARLSKAKSALEAINERKRGKKRLQSEEEVRLKIDEINKKYRVSGIFHCNIQQTTTRRLKRRYKDRPQQELIENVFSIDVVTNQQAVDKAVSRLGWRVYATNHSPEKISIDKAITVYRSEFIIERDFKRLKGASLSLSPTYLQIEDHVVGLIRLLSIALRVLCLLEFIVRNNLFSQEQKLSGLYHGNPKRATHRPTSELLLRAFENITLSVIHLSQQTIVHITPLSDLQLQILALLEFSNDIYKTLAHFRN